MIVILGPTASGKTATALELSKLLPSEIISADSRQVFRYLNIGTAKPVPEELAAVKHHFIDIVDPDEYYSAGRFGDEASEVANDILNRGKIPVVVGGSGLYIRSLCEGFFEEEDSPQDREDTRQKLEKKLQAQGIGVLYSELEKVDPDSAKTYSDRNPRRIVRALEYFYNYNEPFSRAHKMRKTERDFRVMYFGIDLERQELYRRINARSELMWKTGLIEETKAVLASGYSRDLNSLNTVGYKECIAYLMKEMTEQQAIDKMKQSTRNYAKRQMTWFRKTEGVRWLSGTPAECASAVIPSLENCE